MPLMRNRTRVLASFLLVLALVSAGLFKGAGVAVTCGEIQATRPIQIILVTIFG